MKYKLFLFILMVISVLFIVGCQESSQTQPQRIVSGEPNTAQVILLNCKTFPQKMVGIWLNEENGWILRIEENGRLSKIRHTIGRADLAAGKTSTFPLVGGKSGTIEPGPWMSCGFHGKGYGLLQKDMLLRFCDFQTILLV